MRLNTLLITLAAMLFASTSNAAGVPIDPGMWEMTSTMTMSMMPEPKTTVASECIKEDILNPETFNMDEENPCSITDVKIDSNTANWSINCPTQGGPVMQGEWQVTSHGDSLTGKGQMTTELGGQKVGFDMSWKGKRVGDCE
jgi:hypothetical protein